MTARIQLKKKIAGREFKGAWRQDKVIGGKQSKSNSDFDLGL
jgi:hypothetical protein